jgi:hypothetical protein
MIKSILINKYGRLFFSTQLGVIEDFGSPKAGSDSEVVIKLVCMLINNNIIVLFTETLCRVFDCKYIIFALMSIQACGLQNKSFVVFPQTK